MLRYLLQRTWKTGPSPSPPPLSPTADAAGRLQTSTSLLFSPPLLGLFASSSPSRSTLPSCPAPTFSYTHTPSAIFTCSGRRVELEHWMFCHGSPSLPHHRSPPVDPLSWLGLATTATAVFVVDIHGALSYTSYPLVHYLIPLLILVYNTCPTSLFRSKEGLIYGVFI